MQYISFLIARLLRLTTFIIHALVIIGVLVWYHQDFVSYAIDCGTFQGFPEAHKTAEIRMTLCK